MANLPQRTLAPGESLVVHLGGLGLSLGAPGELALFGDTTSSSLCDLLLVGAIPGGKRYERDVSGAWQVR